MASEQERASQGRHDGLAQTSHAKQALRYAACAYLRSLSFLRGISGIAAVLLTLVLVLAPLLLLS
jgi:hypothetical protein